MHNTVSQMKERVSNRAFQEKPWQLSQQFMLWSLWGIVLLGLAWRLYQAWNWNRVRPNVLYGDEIGYDNLARDLLSGYGFTWPGRVPLYPLWLAAIFWLTDGSYTAVRYFQLIPSTIVIILIYQLGRRFAGQTVGIIAALLSAISYILVFQSLRLMSESLYTPIILLVAIASWEAFRKPTYSRFAQVGFLLGVSNLIRPTLFLFPLFIFLALFVILPKHQAWRLGGILILVSGLVVFPG